MRASDAAHSSSAAVPLASSFTFAMPPRLATLVPWPIGLRIPSGGAANARRNSRAVSVGFASRMRRKPPREAARIHARVALLQRHRCVRFRVEQERTDLCEFGVHVLQRIPHVGIFLCEGDAHFASDVPERVKANPGRAVDQREAHHAPEFRSGRIAILRLRRGHQAPASHHLHRALRQGAEEGAPVVLGEDARVEDDDDAFVLLGADEAADALAEFEDGFGE